MVCNVGGVGIVYLLVCDLCGECFVVFCMMLLCDC